MIKAYASFPEPSRSWNFVSTLKIIAMKNIYLLFFALTIGTVHQAQGDFTWAIFDNYTAQHDNYCFDLAMDSENKFNLGGVALRNQVAQIIKPLFTSMTVMGMKYGKPPSITLNI